MTPRDPSHWSREEWAALEADLVDLEREEGIPDPMEAVREYVRRRDIREAAQATWRAGQQPPTDTPPDRGGRCG